MVLSFALCLFTTVQFLRGKKWAWFSAAGITAIVLGFAAFCVWSAFYSRDAYVQSEAMFVLLVRLMVGVPAVITGALLSLGGVRHEFLTGPHPLD
jgi:hypothetical protein